MCAVTGQVDSTIAYGALAAFASPRGCGRWASENLLELTAALILTDCLYLSPAPVLHSARAGDFGFLLDSLGAVVTQPNVTGVTRHQALRLTQKWVTRAQPKLHAHIQNLASNESYGSWIDWHVSNWPEHCQALGGLCDPALLKSVATACGYDLARVLELQKRSSTDRGLRELVKASDNDLTDAITVYVSSILVRGGYYCYVARETGRHWMSHQIRDPEVMPKINTRRASKILEIDNTARYAVTIASVVPLLLYRSRRDRAAAWTTLIQKLRIRQNLDAHAFAHCNSDRIALQRASSLLVETGVDLTPRLVRRAIDIGCPVAGAILTSFVLHSWSAFGAGAVLGTVGRAPLKRASKSWYSRKTQVACLARAEPGQIGRRWTGSITIDAD